MNPTIRYIIQACFDLAVLGIMIATAIQDWKTKIVNPKLQWSLFAVSCSYATYVLIAGSTTGDPGIINGFPWTGIWLIVSGILMFTIHCAIAKFSGGKGIGGADAKVTSIMAMYLGLIQAVIMTVVHSISALIYKFYRYARYKETVVSVRLMPFILIGYIAVKTVWWIIQFIPSTAA